MKRWRGSTKRFRPQCRGFATHSKGWGASGGQATRWQRSTKKKTQKWFRKARKCVHHTHFQAFDGDKFVCMDSYSPRDCLIYSFGVGFVCHSFVGVGLTIKVFGVQIIQTSLRGSLEFEDTVDQLNCTVARESFKNWILIWGHVQVHAYDPTVDIPSTRGAHIRFQKLGVAPARWGGCSQVPLPTWIRLGNLTKDGGPIDNEMIWLSVYWWETSNVIQCFQLDIIIETTS